MTTHTAASSVKRGTVVIAAGSRLGQQAGQVAVETGQHHLGLGVAEADVELEHLGAGRGQHQPGVEHAPVVDAPGPEGRHQRGHRLVDQPGHQGVVDEGNRRVGPHAAGVGAEIRVVTALEVLGRGQGDQALAVAQDQQRALRSGEPLFDHHLAPGIAEGPARQLGVDVGVGVGQRSVTSTPLPAASPSVLMTQGPGRVRR